MISLTAIVPNFNHGRFLTRAILALQNQQPTPSEILVIDDASTDESVAVVEALAVSCPSIRLLRNERNLGTVRSLNRGISEAHGEYVYFAAADDAVCPGFFATAIALLEKHPEAAFACGECLIVNESGTVIGMRPSARPSQRAAYFAPTVVPSLLKRIDNWAHTSTAILRRNMVLSADSLDGDLASFADGYLLRKLALQHGFCFAPSIVAQWMARPDGYSLTIAASASRSLALLNTICEKIKEDPIFPDGYSDLFRRRFRFNISYIAAFSKPPNLEILNAIAGEGLFDRLAINAAIAVPHLGRYLTAAWLVARMQPFSLTALAQTALMRFLEGWRRP